MTESKSKAVFYDHQPFFLCCQSACERLRELNLTENEIHISNSNGGEANQLVLAAILFGVSTLETFINHYAEDFIQEGAWETASELDSLNIRSKWIVIPYIVCREELNTQSSAFKEFLALVQVRNALVHSKPTRIFAYESEVDYEKHSEKFKNRINDRLRLAKRADRIVLNLVNELIALDIEDDVRRLALELFIPIKENK